jgi:hypothetical protein
MVSGIFHQYGDGGVVPDKVPWGRGSAQLCEVHRFAWLRTKLRPIAQWRQCRGQQRLGGRARKLVRND